MHGVHRLVGPLERSGISIVRLNEPVKSLLSMLGRLGTSLYLWITVSSIGALTALAGSLRSNSARSASGVLMISVVVHFYGFTPSTQPSHNAGRSRALRLLSMAWCRSML